MAEDIARLGIEVDSKEIKEAIRRLDALEGQSGKTEKATNKLSGAYGALGGAIAALGVGLLVREIIQANAEFTKLHSSLVTVTGSTEAANEVVGRMKTLMGVIPGSLGELTESFVRLKSLGLEPSERAIISYSNTASAMGKGLNQMIEAVADAATGEFERLKEFGIKAASEGDRVKFTFQGVTTEVGKNAQEIQDYLLGIGEVQFAGAAEKQLNTFGGALDNLGNQFQALLIDEGGMPDATQALKELGATINSPEIKEGFSSLIAGIAKATELAAKGVVAFVDFGKAIGEFAGEAVAGPIEKEATQALALIRDQEEKVKAMASVIDQYNKNLQMLKDDKSVSPERVAAFEEMIEKQQAMLEREEKRLDVMKGINKEVEKSETMTGGAIEQTVAPLITSESGLSDEDKEKLQERFEKLQEHYATETEMALNMLLERQALITELEEANIGTEEERRELRLEATQEYEDALLQIAQDRIRQEQAIKEKADRAEEERIRKNTAFAIRMAEAGNRSATELLRGYLLDQAKMLGQTAIVGAYKWGASIGGPIAGAAAAGAASLAVGAIINAIGDGGSDAASGGSVLSGGGGIGPAPQNVVQAEEAKIEPAKRVDVVFEGDNPHTEAMRTFAENLAETLKDMNVELTVSGA